MRQAFILSVVLGALGLQAALRGEDPTTPPPAPLVLTLELSDGSRIIGAPVEMTTLPLKTDFTKLDVPLHLLSQGEFTANRAAFQLKFKNGDTLTGALELDRLKVKTPFGEANVQLARVARILIREASKPGAPGADAPKAEAPRTDAPKTGAPTVPAPRAIPNADPFR